MKSSAELEQLIECLIQVIGRATMPPDRVQELVGGGRANTKAFNMCDGSATQKNIAKTLRIDQGQLSRTFSRWVESGIAFRVGDGTEARLLHIYPIQQEASKRKTSIKRGKGHRASRRK